jgi:hypothetical protein
LASQIGADLGVLATPFAVQVVDGGSLEPLRVMVRQLGAGDIPPSRSREISIQYKGREAIRLVLDEIDETGEAAVHHPATDEVDGAFRLPACNEQANGQRSSAR